MNNDSKDTTIAPTALAINTTGELATLLGEIQSSLTKLSGRKGEKEVSPEFNALMDGYVSKANECEQLKTKYEHMESYYEEMKTELKLIKDSNKQLNSDLEAAREALRLSESDLQHAKKELEQSKIDFQARLENIVEEKNELKEKIKRTLEIKEREARDAEEKIAKLVKDQDTLKAEILEMKHQHKKMEQQQELEHESLRRTLREQEELINELKEQLDLRTREVEYKDALLNQLIRQAATAEGQSQAQQAIIAQAMHSSNNTNTNRPATTVQHQQPQATLSTEATTVVANTAAEGSTTTANNNASTNKANTTTQSLRTHQEEQDGRTDKNANFISRWGAFRK